MEEPLKQLAWFIRGLKLVCHAIVNTWNVETEEYLDVVIEEAKVAERRKGEKEKEVEKEDLFLFRRVKLIRIRRE